MSPPDHDVHGLTAGYAVDALSGEERERARAHIAACADCRRDLADFHATAVRLAYAEAERPGEAVWERLRAAVPNVRQLPPETAESRPAGVEGGRTDDGGAEGGDADDGGRMIGLAGRRRRREAGRGRARLPWLLTAACAALVLALGAWALVMGQRMQQMQEHTAEVESLLAAADTSMREQPVTQSPAEATVFSSESSGMVMVMVKGLPPTPEDMGYQLWYVDGSGMRSAGMLERSGDGMYTGMAGDLRSAEQLGITMEPAGGMPEPSKEPMKVEL